MKNDVFFHFYRKILEMPEYDKAKYRLLQSIVCIEKIQTERISRKD